MHNKWKRCCARCLHASLIELNVTAPTVLCAIHADTRVPSRLAGHLRAAWRRSRFMIDVTTRVNSVTVGN
jgi:hypothetical protein